MQIGNKISKLETKKQVSKPKALIGNSEIRLETECVASKQSLGTENIELAMFLIDYVFKIVCFQSQMIVSKLHFLFQNYIFCFQSHFTVSKLCFWFQFAAQCCQCTHLALNNCYVSNRHCFQWSFPTCILLEIFYWL